MTEIEDQLRALRQYLPAKVRAALSGCRRDVEVAIEHATGFRGPIHRRHRGLSLLLDRVVALEDELAA